MPRLALAVLVWAGCYHPSPQGGTCNTTAECPAPLQCVGGICGGTNDAASDDALVDADPTCRCVDTATLACASGQVSCQLGCVGETPARCGQLVPSNGMPADRTGSVTMSIAISGNAAIDADTGAISGAITRAAGVGIKSGIRFESVGGYSLFTFAQLSIEAGATVRISGTHAVVFLVGTTAKVDGTIDVSAGLGMQRVAGPGGGAGAVYGDAAAGCGPGLEGHTETSTNSDGGGGGGGGGAVGGTGGAAGMAAPGGAGGAACIAADLQPLVGGSGGGGGAPGLLTTGLPAGGGGGGAIQITALDSLVVNGTINAGGAGGDGGPGNPSGNAPGGGGGGAGGGILLEAITITYGAAAVLAANGGGGGGAANASQAGMLGENAHASAQVAIGGAAASPPATAGGNGGYASVAAKTPIDAGSTANGGGGGGAVGRIFVRDFAGTGPSASIVTSPPAGAAQIVYR